MQVLMMPDYRADNPYQDLLAKSLKLQGVNVKFPYGYRRVFPIFRAITNQNPTINLLHLHWLNPYLKGDRWFTKLIYSIKLVLDLSLVKSKGYKITWTIHNSLPHETKFPLLELWSRRLVAKLVDKIIIHQASSLEELANLYQFQEAKVTVIPHGNYREVYHSPIPQSEARQQLNLSQKGLIYLNLGMLRPYKGVDKLLEIWEKCQSQEDTLVIAGKAGDDAYGDLLQAKASQLPRVFLHNSFIEDDLINVYFSAADIVVCPFQKILTSGSIILAMSFGKPVIAPRFPTIAETLGKANALLYDPQQEEGLLDAIQQSKQVDITALSQQVIAECDRLDWSKIGQQTYEVYTEAL